MARLLLAALAAILPALLPVSGQGQPPPLESGPSTLTVGGRGQVEAEPDQAVLRIGVEIQAETAAAAGQQVDQIVQSLLEALRQGGVRGADLRTSTIMLGPVYSPDQARIRAGALVPEDGGEPRIVAYRATTAVEATVDDLASLGALLDAGIAAGANRVEGITFQLRDDGRQRQQALRRAFQDAEAKALALAEAAGVRLTGLLRIDEGGVDVVRPLLKSARLAAAEPVAVAPGQVTVSASVTVRYGIRPVYNARRR